MTTIARLALAPSLALLLACLASTPVHAVFSIEELRQTMSEQDALTTIRNRRQVTEKLKGADEGYLVLREAGGPVRGMFWTCNGKVHAASAIAEGGIYAFIDRVADLTTRLGRGEIEGSMKPIDSSVSRTLETFFKAGSDGTVKVSYNPPSGNRSEAIWVQNAVTTVCSR